MNAPLPETFLVPDHTDHSDHKVIDYTNSKFPLRSFLGKFALHVRRDFYAQFIASMAPGPDTSILDIGVTPDVSTEDSNYLEQWYPFTDRITATSVEDASNLEKQFPGLTFVPTDGGRLPFEDRQFDIAFSSAVIEHVGSRAQQRQFLAEMLRVSKRYFLTTPNRWFPIELHTFLPFVHWLPLARHQQVLRRVGQEQWATTENLNLLDLARLRSLFSPEIAPTFASTRVLGVRSHLVVYGSSFPELSG